MSRAGRSNCDSFVFAAVSKSWTGGKPKPATVYLFCFQFSAPKACKMGTHDTSHRVFPSTSGALEADSSQGDCQACDTCGHIGCDSGSIQKHWDELVECFIYVHVRGAAEGAISSLVQNVIAAKSSQIWDDLRMRVFDSRHIDNPFHECSTSGALQETDQQLLDLHRPPGYFKNVDPHSAKVVEPNFFSFPMGLLFMLTAHPCNSPLAPMIFWPSSSRCFLLGGSKTCSIGPNLKSDHHSTCRFDTLWWTNIAIENGHL